MRLQDKIHPDLWFTHDPAGEHLRIEYGNYWRDYDVASGEVVAESDVSYLPAHLETYVRLRATAAKLSTIPNVTIK